PSTPGVSPLSLHDALPISVVVGVHIDKPRRDDPAEDVDLARARRLGQLRADRGNPVPGDGDVRRVARPAGAVDDGAAAEDQIDQDRKSTRLNSSHVAISYA